MGRDLPPATVTGAPTFNLRFPGQYEDAETGLHCNYFRDYDASLGRYIQSDPIGLGGGWNTYGYVGGNPVMRVDSEGKDRGLVLARICQKIWRWVKNNVVEIQKLYRIRLSPTLRPSGKTGVKRRSRSVLKNKDYGKPTEYECIDALKKCKESPWPLIFPRGDAVLPDGTVL